MESAELSKTRLAKEMKAKRRKERLKNWDDVCGCSLSNNGGSCSCVDSQLVWFAHFIYKIRGLLFIFIFFFIIVVNDGFFGLLSTKVNINTKMCTYKTRTTVVNLHCNVAFF